MCIHMCKANTLNVEPIIIMLANASKLTDTKLTVLVVNNIIDQLYYTKNPDTVTILIN